MAKLGKAKVARPAAQAAATVGRVFTISMQGIPRVTPQSRARLEAAARSPTYIRRDYPVLNTD
jgi:hypothetical protein